MRDQRKNVRRLVQQTARIVGMDGAAIAPCLIADISATGARLRLEASVVPPEQFVLLLSYDGRLWRKCKLVWRDEHNCGVRFVARSHLL